MSSPISPPPHLFHFEWHQRQRKTHETNEGNDWNVYFLVHVIAITRLGYHMAWRAEAEEMCSTVVCNLFDNTCSTETKSIKPSSCFVLMLCSLHCEYALPACTSIHVPSYATFLSVPLWLLCAFALYLILCYPASDFCGGLYGYLLLFKATAASKTNGEKNERTWNRWSIEGLIKEPVGERDTNEEETPQAHTHPKEPEIEPSQVFTMHFLIDDLRVDGLIKIIWLLSIGDRILGFASLITSAKYRNINACMKNPLEQCFYMSLKDRIITLLAALLLCCMFLHCAGIGQLGS